MSRRCAAVVLILAAQTGFAADEATGPTVGMPATVAGVVLPGSELEARPIEDRMAPLVLRVTEVYKHGDSFRYDLTYYGLEPGEYDLTSYLRRKDGTPATGLPKVPVTVRPILPPGQIEPHGLTPDPSPPLGGYRLALALAGAAWVTGLVAILLVGRRKAAAHLAGGPRRASLADRLRPLVEAARAGTLSPGQHAELERMLIGYWSRKLALDGASPSEAIALMKKDPDAGPLIHQLEAWLHRPGGEARTVDVAGLLEPYRNLPAEPAPAITGASS